MFRLLLQRLESHPGGEGSILDGSSTNGRQRGELGGERKKKAGDKKKIKKIHNNEACTEESYKACGKRKRKEKEAR